MNKLHIKSSNAISGTVTKRVYNTQLYRKALFLMRNGGGEIEVFNILEDALQLEQIDKNLIPTAGKEKIADLIGGSDTSAITHIALGTGTTAAAAGDTALEAETSATGLGRASATVTNETTSTTNDTVRFENTFTNSSGGTVAITEEGLFDASSSGEMIARQVFSVVNVADGDTIQITHDIQIT